MLFQRSEKANNLKLCWLHHERLKEMEEKYIILVPLNIISGKDNGYSIQI